MTGERPAARAEPLRGRRLIIGLSGGIAVAKSASLVSALVQAGAETTVAMTPAAARFVTPLTFEALSGRPVLLDPWTPTTHHDPQHVALARSADAMLIAPATMDLLARLAIGRADDAVALLVAAIDRRTTPVLLAPSMNAAMWEQPATRRAIAQLREDGFGIVEPATGWQACRTEGVGRMPEPEALIDALVAALAVRPRSGNPHPASS